MAEQSYNPDNSTINIKYGGQYTRNPDEMEDLLMAYFMDL